MYEKKRPSNIYQKQNWTVSYADYMQAWLQQVKVWITQRVVYVNIRAGLNRYLRSSTTQRKINLMHDKEFMESNQVCSGLLKTMRRAGLDKTTHKPAISAGDMELYASGVLSNDKPWGLVYKVYF